jgi:zinc D-Ala-D-Ala carboxypeptidase
VLSAYRSFDTQSALKTEYKQTYGSGANTFSADQGYSEHQLGTAVDLTDKAGDAAQTSFKDSQAYTWLQNNAYKYGFELSYPSGNDYYIYEPWHWRFVGIDLATDLHTKGENFYDMDQRQISSYLVHIFDAQYSANATSTVGVASPAL